MGDYLKEAYAKAELFEHQITIDMVVPLLRRGFVAMDADGDWHWFPYKPMPIQETGTWHITTNDQQFWDEYQNLSRMMDIKVCKDGWTNSLIEIING